MPGFRDNREDRDTAAPALDAATLDVTEEAIDPIPGPKIPRTESGGLTPDGRLKSGRLAGLSMRRAIWTLYWPIVLESLLASLVGMTDTYLSAQISVHATDAIGGASYLLWFIGLVVMAVGVGATALISRSSAPAASPSPTPPSARRSCSRSPPASALARSSPSSRPPPRASCT